MGAASGTLVNFVGDNFMAVFDDATDAIGVAIAISAEVEARNAELPGTGGCASGWVSTRAR